MTRCLRWALAATLLCACNMLSISKNSLLGGDGNTFAGLTPLVAVDGFFTASTKGTALGSLMAQGADANSTVRFTLVDTGKLGKAALVDAERGTFSFETDDVSPGFDSFTFTVSQGDETSNVGTIQVVVTDGGVGGTLTYAFVPPSCNHGNCRLDYDNTETRPLRLAQVILLSASDTTQVLGTTISDEQGHYLFPAVPQTQLVVQVLSSTASPSITVQDNTQAGAVYAMTSPVVDTIASTLVNLHADTGWDGSGYAAARTAAPFAILDTALTASLAFAAVRPNITFAPLTINWSVDNVPQSGDVAAGMIGSSFWSGAALYLLGAADIDSDEYDAHVIGHEWGHYFETTQSRSDSNGGQHFLGEVYDIRLAFSEGWANALSAMVLYPQSTYIDVFGQGQSQAIAFDLADSQSYDTQPGYFSEASVQGTLYDLFDPAKPEQPDDQVSIDLGVVWDVMHGPHAHNPAVTSLFSFVHGLKSLHPELSDSIDAITTARQIEPILDVLGTNQQQGNNFAATLTPFYLASFGQAVTVTLENVEPPTGDSIAAFNFGRFKANRLIRFIADGAAATVTVTCPVRPRVYIFGPLSPTAGRGLVRSGTSPCSSSDGAGCPRVMTLPSTVDNEPYIVNLSNADPAVGEITCTVLVAH